MKMTWVNHSGHLVTHGGVALLTDPWIEGAVFDDGLELLLPSVLRPEDFDLATHLWFSHEHPDHFFPSNLVQVPEPVRTGLKVLYQDADFGQVQGWCEGKGFPVQVLKSGRWVELGEDFEVLCQPFSLLDSWMAIRAGGQQIVNLNDCTLDSEEAARQVLSSVGDRPIDLVMLQYSFGGYAGETAQERLDAGSHMLWRIQMVSRILRPRFFMPCASFTWFCHRENHHLNAQSNRIQKVFRFMEKRCHGQPIVLLPGESWEVGTAHKSKKAVGRYRAAFAEKLRATDLRTSSSVDGPELQALAQGFLKRLKKANPDWEALRRFHMIEPTAIFVVDQDCAWELHPDRGLNPVSVSASDCDVALASGSLAHALRLPWGGSTVGINGRFTKPPGGYYERFKAWFAISVYNHHKKRPRCRRPCSRAPRSSGSVDSATRERLFNARRSPRPGV